jgi:hypothetical protein
VVTFGRKKNLGLVFQPTESLAVENPVPVNLENCPHRTGFLSNQSSSGCQTVAGMVTEHVFFRGLNNLSYNHLSSPKEADVFIVREMSRTVEVQ